MKGTARASARQQRRETILAMLGESDDISTDDFAAHFNVCNYTIRRDLIALAGEGRIKRYHGGARLSGRPVQAEERADKFELVSQMLPSVFEGCHIYIDSPYLAESLVDSLPNLNIKIFTNDLNVYHRVKNKDKIRMFFLGSGFGGGDAEFNFANFIPPELYDSVDIAIVEAGYIDGDGFVLSDCMSGAARNRLAIEKAEYRYLIQNETKTEQSKPYTYKVCSTDKIERIFEVTQ